LKRDLRGLKRKSTRSSPEQDLKNAILQWLRLYPHRFLAWPNSSTGIFDPVRKCFRKPAKYFLPGTGDIFVLVKETPTTNAIFVSIECKSKTGKVRPDQEIFINSVNDFGAYSFVARTLDEVINRLGKLV